MATYAITISPPYKPYNSPLFLYQGDKPLIRKRLNLFSNYYNLYPELDEKNRLHYHGIIKIKDMIKYRHVKYKLDRELGYIKINKFQTFQDKLRYLLYSMKQWPENQHYFKTPIIYKSLKRRKKIQIKNILNNYNNILNYYS